MVDEIVWTGNLGSSILRVQQAGNNPVMDESVLAGALEQLPEDGDVADNGPPEEAVQNFLEYSLEQIEAMIDLVRGDLDRSVFLVVHKMLCFTFFRASAFKTDVYCIAKGPLVTTRLHGHDNMGRQSEASRLAANITSAMQWSSYWKPWGKMLHHNLPTSAREIPLGQIVAAKSTYLTYIVLFPAHRISLAALAPFNGGGCCHPIGNKGRSWVR